jgi:UDP:flavonoid glycosyltransferase YjiC (YdhE family)
MAHIVTVTRGLPSVVYQAVEVARRLAAAGHQVTFAGGPEALSLVTSQGIAFHSLAPDRFETFASADAGLPLARRVGDLRARTRRAIESLGVSGFSTDLRGLRPDLVLINGEMHAHAFAAMATGVPVAILNSFVSIWRRPGLPPPHHLARPGVGWRGSRAGHWLQWEALRLRKRYRVARERLRLAGCDRVATYRALARALGIDFDRETDAGQWLIPFTYRRCPAITLHALEFEFPHAPPPHVRYVGPMVLRSRADRPLAEVDRARLEQVFARRAGGADGGGRARRILYAGFGSAFSTDVGFVRRLLGVVSDRPDWDLVISLGGRLVPGDVGPAPERVHVFPWLPQVEVLRHADVAICHGGVSTVDECVLSSVPVLIYCGWETDIAGTTSRVLHHGLGLAGDRRRDGAADVRAHVDRLLLDHALRERVERFRRLYEAYATGRVLERAVESLLAPPAPGHGGCGASGARAAGGPA